MTVPPPENRLPDEALASVETGPFSDHPAAIKEGEIESPAAGLSEAARLGETLLLPMFAGNRELHDSPAADSPQSAATDALVGQQLSVYRIISLLGQGGMGRVYLAEHKDLHRLCALKILAPSRIRDDEDYVARFRNEGRAAASLIHPSVITIHAIGECQGYHFLEMEFVAGRSLHQVIRSEGRLTAIRASVLTARIADGLAAAHRNGIIHRDLKPDNVLMTHQGIPKIADFGLAKRVAHPSNKGLPEGLLGTPKFMAPELFAGQPAGPESDVYALGVTYFQMLTGRVPYDADSLNRLIAEVSTAPLPNVRKLCPDVTLEMAECLSLLLAKSPRERPRDGIEAAQLLNAVVGQVRDLYSLLREAFANDSHVQWEREDRRFRVVVKLPDGRRQTLYIEPSEHRGMAQLLLIYSICCPADPAYYEYVLRLNSEIPHGGLAIREIDGTPRFIMADTYPRATVDPEEIRRSVLEVAIRADFVEHLLTGLDQH